MINILHVIRNVGNGGTERFLFNLLINTSKEYNNIILTYSDVTHYKNIIEENNIKIIKIMDPNKSGLINNIKDIKKVIKDNKIDIVYSYTHYNSGYVMLAAFLCGVKVRITHSHRTESTNNRNIKTLLYNFVSKFLINIFSNNCLACGEEARNALFYRCRKVKLINNGIDIDKFIFSQEIRKKMRKKYNISDDTVVIGTIGRLDDNKNQKFLISVFDRYHQKNKESKLVIIGDGENKEKLVELGKKFKIDSDIIFTGNVSNANDYYNLMDVFCLTSINEGLPYVLIEAQTNGLNCIVSDSVDKKSNIAGNIKFINLNENYSNWVSELESINKTRSNNIKKIIANGYSIDNTITEIMNIYNYVNKGE